MKKISIILLIAMFPFLTTAQKRNKKKDKNIEVNNILRTANEFMIVNVNESVMSDFAPDRIKAIFDYPDMKSEEIVSLSKNQYRSISELLSSVGSYGWELVDVSVFNNGNKKIHYFYMTRRR
jgi:hypothetical protein